MKMGKRKVVVIVVAAVVAVLAITYLVLGIFFYSHFWFRTEINGVDCSGKNVEAVERVIIEEIDNYQLTLELRDGNSETIQSEAIALRPVFDGSIQRELKARSGFAWPVSLFRKTVIELETMVEYDGELLETEVAKLNCMDILQSKKPEDAYISEYMVGKGYEIIPEQPGTLIDKQVMNEVLHSGIINLQNTISLEEMNCYVQPEVTAEDEQLNKTVEALNTCISAVVTYEFGSNREVVDGSLIHKWLRVSEENEVVIEEEQVAEYLKELASKYNTYGKTRSFATSYGATVHLYTNTYGWRINQSEELLKLMENILNGENISREPLYSQRAKSYSGNDYGDTYVEINLTAQHLYFYKNGALLLEADFVSGDLEDGNGTPGGAFSIYYKETDRILRGEDYATPVDYWMPFNGGIGLHDATWRSDFGGSYYKASGSHGCINLPYSVAKKIYNNIEAGDAVFVYELPGTESAKGIAQDAAWAVDKAIEAIGNVTLDSAGTIGAARAAYDALNDMAKGYVKNLDVLMYAESVYGTLVYQQQEAMMHETAKQEAQPVIDAINAIGEVTAEKAKEIKKIRKQYDKLSDLAKQYVTNIGVLQEAENILAGLE